MSSPSALLKVNYLVMRYLHFGSVLGDLQEGYFFASRCHLSRCSSTKMPILCPKSPKMGDSNPKSAQKPRFCARNARKRWFLSPKKHKNPDFVLEKPENEGFKPQKRTKTSILCSKCPKTRVPNPQKHKNPDFVLGKVDRRAWE